MRLPRPFRFARSAVALLTLSALSTLAAAQDDLPARVGRIALTQGQVSIAGDVGAELMPAQINYPVTTGTAIATGQGARTELRIGSTSIRLDGDSSLEVSALDDGGIRLRLNYGSASVRVLDTAVAAGFELETPQARVRLQQPGTVRIDAERVQGVSAVEVFAGGALVDGGGSELTIRAGKRVELGDDDVRTMTALRDGFDDWSAGRDRVADGATSVRYVGADMTGYEDLDRYGNWRDDGEYGPLWTPAVASDWVPYRDGSWTWLEPWGWTWVDNAPWGYAPFHYGRWVYLNNRWAWAPGRRHDHPVWSPALVGWVGGAGWNVAFRDRGTRPAFGWYPLTPHDRFVPGYRVSEAHLRWVNDNVRPDPRRPRDFRPQGLTVVPQDRFNRPGRVDVPRAPFANPAALRDVPGLAMGGRMAGAGASMGAGAPPPPPERLRQRPQGNGWGVGGGERFGQHAGEPIGERYGERNGQRDGERGAGRQGPVVLTAPSVTGAGAQGLGVVSPTPRQPPQALGVTSPTPHLPPQAQGVVSPTPRPSAQAQGVVSPTPSGWQRDDRRDRWDEARRQDTERIQSGSQPAWQSSGPVQSADGRGDRARRGDWERRQSTQPAAAPLQGQSTASPSMQQPAQRFQPQMQSQPQPQQQMQHQPQQPSMPQATMEARAARRSDWERPHEASSPAPAAMAQRPATAAPAAPRAAEREHAGESHRGEQRGPRQQER